MLIRRHKGSPFTVGMIYRKKKKLKHAGAQDFIYLGYDKNDRYTPYTFCVFGIYDLLDVYGYAAHNIGMFDFIGPAPLSIYLHLVMENSYAR